MAEVKLTPAQQSQIDVANAKLSSAKSEFDSATTDAGNKLSDMNRCVCGKGKSLGRCYPLKATYTFPNLADSKYCGHPPDINKCNTDCCKESTCTERVNTYNTAIGVYNATKVNYETAKDNLKSVLDAIAKDPTVGVNAGIIVKEIDAQKSKDMIKWAFFGLTAVIIVGAAIFIGMRMVGGRSVSA